MGLHCKFSKAWDKKGLTCFFIVGTGMGRIFGTNQSTEYETERLSSYLDSGCQKYSKSSGFIFVRLPSLVDQWWQFNWNYQMTIPVRPFLGQLLVSSRSPFHSIPFHSIPFHSIPSPFLPPPPFSSIPFIVPFILLPFHPFICLFSFHSSFMFMQFIAWGGL